MGKASAASTTATAAAAAATTEMKRKKKKGRPSLSDLQKRQQQQPQHLLNSVHKKTLTPSSSSPPSNSNSAPARRSTRRNPVAHNSSPPPFDEDDDDDDDDERKEKKVKLVVRLPQSNNLNNLQQNSQHSDSGSGSEDSDADVDLGGEDHPVASPKKRKINARSDGAGSDQGEKSSKATDALHGSQLESGPTTHLPDKKLLVFILDRLQKKDTYGVFSEPVDPNELPDYHEIIEHPMDFGTLRKKLDEGLYSNLEELEADVLLICSNAMQYNAPDTVYFRQARSIQELAKRDFSNLRHEDDDGEPQPKVVRRGRPPSKNQKKSLERSPVDHMSPELSSGATLASGEDKAFGSNSQSQRKAPTLQRFRSSDALVTPHRSRTGESYSDFSTDWNSEFPASILRADMKYGKKNFIVDENKRDTYKDYQPSAFDNELSLFPDIDGDMKQLMPVGIQFERHAYARSLARFASNLGPVAWKVASRKIESVLPAGVKFGCGWVGEVEATSELSSLSTEKQKSPSNLASDHHSSRPVTPSVPSIDSSLVSRPSEEMVEAVRRLNSQNEMAVQGSAAPWGMQGSPFQARQKSMFHPNRNGYNGMFGYNLSSQLGMTGPAMPSAESGQGERSMPCQMLGMASRNDASAIYPASSNRPCSEVPKVLESWGMSSANLFAQGKAPDPILESEGGPPHQELSEQHRQSLPIPPDLNVRIPAPGMPSSSSQIGSPQQPDLALQL